jgi:hypothetical protein
MAKEHNVIYAALRPAEMQHKEKCNMAEINKQGRMQYGKTEHNDEKKCSTSEM